MEPKTLTVPEAGRRYFAFIAMKSWSQVMAGRGVPFVSISQALVRQVEPLT